MRVGHPRRGKGPTAVTCKKSNFWNLCFFSKPEERAILVQKLIRCFLIQELDCVFPGLSISSLTSQILSLTKSPINEEASVNHMPRQQDELKFPFLGIFSHPLHPRRKSQLTRSHPICQPALSHWAFNRYDNEFVVLWLRISNSKQRRCLIIP